MQDALEGLPSSRDASDTLGAVWRDWLADVDAGELHYRQTTVDTYRSVMENHVLPLRVGNIRIEALPIARLNDADTLQATIDKITARSTNEIGRLASKPLRALLKYQRARKRLRSAPPTITLPPANRPSKGAIERDDMRRLVDAAQARGPYAYALLNVLGYARLRIDEIVNLTWDDIAGGQITVRVSKTDAGLRSVGVDEITAAALEQLREVAVGEYVFGKADGTKTTRSGRPRYELRKVAEAAGVEGVGFHRFRHTHISMLALEGGNEAAIAARAGHTDASFTKRRYIAPLDIAIAELQQTTARTR